MIAAALILWVIASFAFLAFVGHGADICDHIGRRK